MATLNKTKATTRRGRRGTPYFEAAAMLGCFHEAGHVVVIHDVGWHIEKVTIEQTIHAPVSIRCPFLARTNEERETSIARTRDAMTILAAGPVAAVIHQEAVDREGKVRGQAMRAYSAWWEILASTQVECDMENSHDPANDSYRLRKAADDICFALELEQASHILLKAKDPNLDPVALLNKLAKGRAKRVVTEIEQAEQRAERIIRRDWTKLSDIATTLHKNKRGVLHRKQLLPLLDRHVAVAV